MLSIVIVSLAAFVAIVLIIYNSYTSSCLNIFQRIEAWLYKRRKHNEFTGYSGAQGMTSSTIPAPSPEKTLPTIDLARMRTAWDLPAPSSISVAFNNQLRYQLLAPPSPDPVWRLIDANDPISVSIPSVTQIRDWNSLSHDPMTCPVCRASVASPQLTSDSKPKTVKRNDRYSILKNRGES